MRTIYKYQFEVGIRFSLEMPVGAQILTVQPQAGIPCMWALVETNRPVTRATFQIVGTGHQAPDENAAYVGTFQDGPFVWHVFRLPDGTAAQ